MNVLEKTSYNVLTLGGLRMAEDKNAAHAAAEEFAAWLAQTQPARTVSECYAAIIEADAFLLKRNLSRRSLFLLDKRSVVSLLTSLRGNRVFRSQATVSMQKMQKAAALLGDFIDERDQRIADKLLGILTQSKPEAMKPSVASTSEPVEEPRPPVPTLLENRIFTFDGTDLRAAVINNKLHYVDHLAAEGAFWLVGGQELEPFVALAKEKGYDFNFKQEGSRSSNWMPCWWYQPTKKLEAPPVPAVTYFNGMLDDPQYVPLRDALIQNGIADLEALRNINLWLFMNSHNLYTIQRRLAVSNELHDKLQILDTVSDAAESCVIFVFDKEFKGATPSDAFAALMAYVATKYPLRFRSVCSLIHPKTMKVVLRRNDYDGSRIKLINPEVYIDRDLTKEQIEEYTDWVLTKCTGNAPTFSVACSEAKQNEPESVSYIVKKAENCLLAADLDGLSLDDLQAELGMTIAGTKETAAQSPCIIEMGGRFYHQEAFVDFEEAADAMTEILDKLIKKNNGVVSTKQMVEYARSEMQMFLNDNGLTDPQQIIDLAQHLFDEVKYKGVHYAFKGNMYISAPDAVMETFSDIVRNFALASSSTGIDVMIDICSSDFNVYRMHPEKLIQRMKKRLTDYFTFLGNDREGIAKTARAQTIDELIYVYVDWYYMKYLCRHNEQFLDLYDFIEGNTAGSSERINEAIKDFFALPFVKLKSDEMYYGEMSIKELTAKAIIGISRSTMANIERVNGNRYSYKLDYLLFCAYLRYDETFEKSRLERLVNRAPAADRKELPVLLMKLYQVCSPRGKLAMLNYLDQKPNRLQTDRKSFMAAVYKEAPKDIIYYGFVAQQVNQYLTSRRFSSV